jgi:hypothetical protein
MATFRDVVTDALVVSVAGGIIYFSGWAFLSNYLSAFGIDPTQVSIPLTTVLVYAFRVLQSPWLLGYLAFVLIIGSVCIVWARAKSLLTPPRWERRTWHYAFWPVALILSLGLASFTLFAVNWIAGNRATELAAEVWLGNRPETIVEVTREGSFAGSELARRYFGCARSGLMRLIIGLPDRTYLLCRSDIQPCQRALVFAITNEGRIAAVTDWQRPSGTREEACEKPI